MSVRIVRLGTPRGRDEGVRIGTVRRPPRGVPKALFGKQNWYDVWFPNLAPSVPIMKLGLGAKTPAATGVAVLSTLDKGLKERIRAAFMSPSAKAIATAEVGLDVRKMQPIAPKEYDYVATLGYFTPRVLDGVKIVTAEEAAAMMQKGVVLYDTRVEEEHRESHIKGAKWLPYGEKSAKEVGFDAAKDSFDLARIGDKSAPVIFACNGPECWKSYKSCVTAVKAGYTQVYWLRGGYPEWVANGYATESVPTTVALPH